jgi:TetR/AcrR family transcriptional regulator, lmrAB and yxaGH operons repressor
MTNTKQRMVEATADSMRRRGVAATSFTELLEHSGAARGAIYHHFPGGKAELAEAAVRWTGDNVAAALATLRPASETPGAVVEAFLELVRPVVLESAQGAGCAVAAACTESDTGSPLQLASRAALSSWRKLLAARLTGAGAEETGAWHLASLLVSTLEGAHVLCRAEGSIEPFDAAAAALLSLRASTSTRPR